MAPSVVQTTIARPADEVFAYLRDFANQEIWQKPNVLQVRVEPPGPANVGTVVHKVRRTPMGKLEFTEEVTVLDDGQRRWVEVTRTGGIKGTRLEWQVREDPIGARVHLTAEMHGVGINRLLLPIIKRQATHGWRSEQAQLKQILEASTST